MQVTTGITTDLQPEPPAPEPVAAGTPAKSGKPSKAPKASTGSNSRRAEKGKKSPNGKSSEPQLENLSIKVLVPHPDNPRMGVNQAVIESITEQIKRTDKFPSEHALLVRPLGNGKHQIVAGHQRFQAAVAAGIAKVWCWVKNMDDETASMALVLTNEQAELTSLERALHAHGTIERYARTGMNQSSYAQLIGKSQPHVSHLVNAATVYQSIRESIGQLMEPDAADGGKDPLGDKTQHLGHIHGLPEDYWAPAVKKALEDHWSASITKKVVKEVQLFEELCNGKGNLAQYIAGDEFKENVIREIPGSRTVRLLAVFAEIFTTAVDELPEKADYYELKSDAGKIETRRWEPLKEFAVTLSSLVKNPDLLDLSEAGDECDAFRKKSEAVLEDLAKKLQAGDEQTAQAAYEAFLLAQEVPASPDSQEGKVPDRLFEAFIAVARECVSDSGVTERSNIVVPDLAQSLCNSVGHTAAALFVETLAAAIRELAQ